jgi:hypothetical protein
MGAPTSAILAEIYIQNMEHTQIYDILIKQHIIAYFRYIDDILIVYDSKKTNIDDTINKFNKLLPKIKFTIEKDQESISFLDIEIRRGKDNFQFAIYRKKTATDTIIPSDSCHPHEHKIAGIKYLLNRVDNYPITKIAKDAELNILQHNNYNIDIIARLSTKKEKLSTSKNQVNTKWATFTYIGKETRKITKIFQNNNKNSI